MAASQENQQPGAYEAEDLLALQTSARVRACLINKLTANGTKIPEDKSDKVFLLGLMDGADKQVFNKVKVKQVDKANETAALTGGEIAAILRQVTAPVRRPRAANLTEPEGVVFRPLVPGEIEIGCIPLKPEDVAE